MSRGVASRQMRMPGTACKASEHCVVVSTVDLVVQRTVVAHHVWDAALELEPEALSGAY